MDSDHDRQQLIAILQNAYSGEQAAAYAYRGHWKSVSDGEERRNIQRIEHEEWVHREEVGKMLAGLGAKHVAMKEIRTWIVGRGLGVACHMIGWFLPMYFAGRLESGNAAEYETAAGHASRLGLEKFVEELRVMAEVEKEHEVFFHSMVADHPWLPRMRRIFGWG
jgi:demethoxyubiquinone hydroxylase (CLK1/Coq7/Cat5 family)